MARYEVAIGHNNALALTTVTPQPATPDGIRHPQRFDAGDGTSTFKGFRFTVLRWTVATNDQRNAILAAYGLSDTIASAQVTVQIPDNADDSPTTPSLIVRNATARHDPGRGRGIFWRNLEIELIHLKATT